MKIPRIDIWQKQGLSTRKINVQQHDDQLGVLERHIRKK